MQKRAQILCVEDQADFQFIIKSTLKEYDLIFASSLREARLHLEKRHFDLILLDINLPDGDGLRFFGALAEEISFDRRTPVLFLTSSSQIEDKVMAFNLGAVDFICKPIHPSELRARVKARLRNDEGGAKSDTLKLGDIEVSQADFVAFRMSNGERQEILLTLKEFKLLACLLKNAGQILSREQLLDAVWGTGTHVIDRTIDTHISHLRKKIQSNEVEIRSIPSMGYRIGPKELESTI